MNIAEMFGGQSVDMNKVDDGLRELFSSQPPDIAQWWAKQVNTLSMFLNVMYNLTEDSVKAHNVFIEAMADEIKKVQEREKLWGESGKRTDVVEVLLLKTALLLSECCLMETAYLKEDTLKNFKRKEFKPTLNQEMDRVVRQAQERRRDEDMEGGAGSEESGGGDQPVQE